MFKNLVAVCIAISLTVMPIVLPAASLDSPISGTIVYAKGDEFLRENSSAKWQPASGGDNVANGNEVRTGPYGSLAIVLRDETQIRLRRNSLFIVDDVRDASTIETTKLQLLAGALWSRAQSLSRLVKAGLYKRPKVQIITKTSTIGIRGTDWFVSVDPTSGTSRTVVISGAAEVSNAFGSVDLQTGEEAIAEPGKAPVKRVIVDLKNRPLFSLEYNVDWNALTAASSNAPLKEAATLAANGQFARSKTLLDTLPTPSPEAEVEAFRVALLMNNAEYDPAIKLAQQAATQFPNNAVFDSLLGHAYLLTDEPEQMFQSIESGLRKDPTNAQVWHLRGIYYTAVEPNEKLALASYEQALALNPTQAESANNLGLLNYQLGHYQSAKTFLAQARNVQPDSALVQGNSGLLAQNLDRPAEADQYFEQAEALDATSPHLQMAKGSRALLNGEHDVAINHFLSAITIQPDLPDAHTSLAIAYYQAGRFEEAKAMINKAIALDPDDPVAPKIGTTMSVDQADIGRAIRLAKDALEKSQAYDYFAVESLESARSGVTNLGAAYASLGLTSWANYYAQLAFTPYEATSHFLLSSVYGARSNTASNGALNMGLSLAPTAISEPNRFFEFVREPGIDFTIGGSRGDAGGDTTRTGNATVQGFNRLPVPFSYRLDYSDSDNEGSNDKGKVLNISAGTRLGERQHHFSTNFFASKDNGQVDTPAGDVERGDRSDTTVLAGSLTYHLRLDYDNRIIARAGFQRTTTSSENRRPFGSEISRLGQALVTNFGEPTARQFIDEELFDLNTILGAPCSALEPCIGLGSFFSPFGPMIDETLPNNVIGDSVDELLIRSNSDAKSYYVQFRHMIGFDRLNLTYGFEFMDRESSFEFTNSDIDFDSLGFGTLIDDAFNFIPFTLFDTVERTFDTKRDPSFGSVYLQGRYEFSDEIWIEAAVFARYLNDDIDVKTTQIDPRIGFGWRVLERHWLRAAFQRELIQAIPPLGPVAPVATMGFVPIITQVLDGSTVKNTQVEWDAEWHDRIFTSIRFEEQSIDGWIPLSSPVFIGVVDEARIRSIDANINMWVCERFGVSANYLYQTSENQQRGTNYGNDLPFIPESSFSMGVTWIHPRQVTASASMNYVDKRAGDLANSIELSDYWTTNLGLSWQPLDKHASIGVRVLNLFDEDFDIAPGVRSVGRTAIVSFQARF